MFFQTLIQESLRGNGKRERERERGGEVRERKRDKEMTQTKQSDRKISKINNIMYMG